MVCFALHLHEPLALMICSNECNFRYRVLEKEPVQQGPLRRHTDQPTDAETTPSVEASHADKDLPGHFRQITIGCEVSLDGDLRASAVLEPHKLVELDLFNRDFWTPGNDDEFLSDVRADLGTDDIDLFGNAWEASKKDVDIFNGFFFGSDQSDQGTQTP